MPSTDARSRFALLLVVLVTACRSSPMPHPSVDPEGSAGATVGTSVSTEEAKPARRGWPSKTPTGVVRLRVRALTCQGCAWQIGETLAKDDGIADVATSVPEKTVTVRYDAAKTTAAKIKASLANVGYESEELP